jgi:hypothetical protein
MYIERRFVRGLLILAGVAVVLFGLEFLFEWFRAGRPGLEDMSYASSSRSNVANNVKLVDVLSPTARAYNNILAMLIAAVGLAIPLTANMHTPKLIEMFLRDRVNRIVLVFGALGAAHVLWVGYLLCHSLPRPVEHPGPAEAGSRAGRGGVGSGPQRRRGSPRPCP